MSYDLHWFGGILIDPWEEAARLSAMTEPIAKSRLISVLNKASENSWSPSQQAAIAKRLIASLPSTNDRAGLASAQVSEVNGRMLILLICWWSFAIGTAFFSSYQQRVDKTAVVSTTYSSSTAASKDVSADTKATVATIDRSGQAAGFRRKHGGAFRSPDIRAQGPSVRP